MHATRERCTNARGRERERESEKRLTSATNADDKSTLRNREVDLYRTRRVPLTHSFFLPFLFFSAHFSIFFAASPFAILTKFSETIHRKCTTWTEWLRNRMAFLALLCCTVISQQWLTYPCSIRYFIYVMDCVGRFARLAVCFKSVLRYACDCVMIFYYVEPFIYLCCHSFIIFF